MNLHILLPLPIWIFFRWRQLLRQLLLASETGWFVLPLAWLARFPPPHRLEIVALLYYNYVKFRICYPNECVMELRRLRGDDDDDGAEEELHCMESRRTVHLGRFAQRSISMHANLVS